MKKITVILFLFVAVCAARGWAADNTLSAAVMRTGKLVAPNVPAVVESLSGLRAMDRQSFTSAYVKGASAAGDGGGDMFRWDDTNTMDDDDYNVLKPDGISGAGRWVRLTTYRNTAPLIIAASGQSNMVGLPPDPPTPGATDGTFKVYKDVKIWNPGTGAFETADFQNNAITMLSGNILGRGVNNLAVAFCDRLYEATGRPCYLIIEALAGKEIDNWIGLGTASGMYQNLRTSVTAALAAIGKNTVHAMLWMQGERDAVLSRTQEEYADDLKTLLVQLHGETWFPESKSFIAGRLAPQGPYTGSGPDLAIAALNSDNDPTTSAADSTGLASITLSNVHYTGAALYTLGHDRFWDALPASFIDNLGLVDHDNLLGPG